MQLGSEESVYKWYAEQDSKTDETIIYANFQEKIRTRKMWKSMCVVNAFPFQNRSKLYYCRGTICKAATTWAPPAAFQDGMIGPHWSKGWIIEDCDISNSKCAGISVGKYLDPDNDHYFTYKYVKESDTDGT